MLVSFIDGFSVYQRKWQLHETSYLSLQEWHLQSGWSVKVTNM